MKSISLSRRKYPFLIVLFTTEFSRGALFLTFLPAYYADYLGLSIAVTGLAVSAHYLSETLCKIFAGWHVDRYGKPVLVTGLFLCLTSLVFMKYFSYPSALILTSALIGLGVSPLWLGIISKVAPVESTDRAFKIGLVFTAWLSGAGSGLISINFIIAAFGYDFAFWLIFFLMFASLVVTLFFPWSARTTTGAKGFKTTRISSVIEKMSRNKTLTNILIPGMFLQTMSVGLLLPILPIYAREHLGMDHNTYGLLVLTGGLAAVVCLLPMGKLTDNLKIKPLLAAGFGFSALFLTLLANSRETLTSYFFIALLGISYAAVLPAWNSLLAKTIPVEQQATGWGVFSTVEGLGIATGPALGGLIANSAGIGCAISMTVGTFFLMSLFYLFYPLEKYLAK